MQEKVTMSTIVDVIAQKYDLTKVKSSNILKDIVEIIKLAVIQDGSFRINHLGTIKKVNRKAKRGFNPKTREPMLNPAYNSAKFSPSMSMKQDLNK
jgi:DNA-binding protein HU-beta